MSERAFWRELKRRHVYRVAAAYAIVGWLLIQVVTQVFPIFHLPDWIDQAIVLVILVGFPIALVLAWSFDATPHGIVLTDAATDGGAAGEPMSRRSRRTGIVVGLIGVLVAVAAGAAWWNFQRNGTTAAHAARVASARPAAAASAATLPIAGASTSRATPTSLTSAQPIPAKSIAVLPFENLSTDKGNAYFADGMQDLILTKLADIGDLKVISRTSTEQYGSHPQNLKSIGQQLGVATVLEGSVQKARNQVLINVQLIDANTDSHIWAESYTRTLDNIFGVEGEVAQKVADALKAKLTPAETKAIASVPTHDKQAYDDFLKGTYYLYDAQDKEQPGEFEQAVMFLQQAVKHDPTFANAFSALAASYRHMGGHHDQAEAAVRRALALNPDSTFAHIQMARLLDQEGLFRQAFQQAHVALHKEPNNAGLVNGLGNIYVDAGRYREALAAYKHAIELSSNGGVAATARVNMASVLATQRRFADAREPLIDVLAHDPSQIGAASLLASVYEAGWGNLDSARKVLEAVPVPATSSGALSDAWYWLDLYGRDYAAALKVIGEAPASWFTSEQYPLGLYQGQVYLAQADIPHAKAAFAEARIQLEGWIKTSPDDADLHAELALVLAGLGERNVALDEARHAMALQPVSKYPYAGIAQIANMAVVQSCVGAAGAAINLVDRLLSMPAGMYVSVALLRIGPAWNPIRHDPRFQALLKKYSQPAPASSASSGAGDE